MPIRILSFLFQFNLTKIICRPTTKKTSSFPSLLIRLENDEASTKREGLDHKPGVREENLKKEVVITMPVKTVKNVTKGTQTDFRESECQTLPWKHDIITDKKILKELLLLESLSLGNELFRFVVLLFGLK